MDRAAGEAMRRRALGDAYVDASHEAETPFTAPFFALIEGHAFGEIWSRPGLAMGDRRMLVLAMLLALGAEAEFELHLRAALADGIKPEAVQELLLLSTLYAGYPRAYAGIRIAEKLLRPPVSPPSG